MQALELMLAFFDESSNVSQIAKLTERTKVPKLTENGNFECIVFSFNNFYFRTSFWYLKRVMKAFKAFIKPFEAPQKSVKIKI